MTSLKLHIQPPEGAAIERECGAEPLVLGRSAEADVVIDDSSMSRRHARIVAQQGVWLIEDLGARNGTYVNGERIEGRRPLAIGDLVQMGGTTIRVGGDEPGSAVGALGRGELGSSIFRSLAELAAAEAASQVAPARAAARLKALNDVHRALAGPVSLDALLDLLLERLFAVLQAEEGLVLLKQADGSLKTAATRRLPGMTGELVVSRRLTEEVVGKETAALVSDLAMDDRFTGAVSMIGAGIRSILAAPITDAEGCVGMVAVYSRAQVRRFGEEDLELLVSLASAAAVRIRSIATADEAAARQVRDREQTLAHEIRKGTLPRAIPQHPEVQLAATLTPAWSVGGDLYDFLVIDDALWVIVADAAGNGVSAALAAIVTRTLFRALAQASTSVADVASRMNEELARDGEPHAYVTAFIGRLDLASGELRYSGAGHPPPLISTATRLAPLTLPGNGVALGIARRAIYEEGAITLAPGDVLLAFTDGVTEAANTSGESYSDARLGELFAGLAGDPPQHIVDSVVKTVSVFATGAPLQDDITVVALKYRAD